MNRTTSIQGSFSFSPAHFFLVVLACCIGLFWTNVSVYMDDVFIYLRVAKNIVNGTGPVLNPGDSHFPVTSPLWVFLLAALYKILGFLDMMVLSKILFIIFLALASWLAFVSVRHRIGIWAILSPLVIFFNYITVSSTGGEIALVYFSLFGVLWAYSRKGDFILTGIFLATAYLSRGELILLLIPIGFHYILIALREKKSAKKVTLDLGQIILGFLVIAFIWHFYYAIQFHSIFPNTLNTKIVQGKSGMWDLYYRYGRIHTLSILNGHYYLLFFLVFGLFYFRFLSYSLLTFTILHYYTYEYLIIPYYHWYFYDFYLLIPLFTLFGIIAFFVFLKNHLKTFKWYSPKGGKFTELMNFSRLLSIFTAALVLASVLITTQIGRLKNFRADPRLTRYTRCVEWIKPNLKKGDVILAHEIGIVGYFLEDIIIRDLNGIASPDVTVENINDLGYFVTTYSPRFIFFPFWLPQENSLKYVVVKDRVAVYEKGYAETENNNVQESVFIFKTTLSSRPYIRNLEQLRKNARYYPDSEFEIIKKDRQFVLSAPPPFVSRIKVPGTVTGISVSFGFLPRLSRQNQVRGDGAFFKIYGVKERSRSLLYQKHLIPFKVTANYHMGRASISFPGGGFGSLEFVIEAGAGKDSDFGCTYWGPLRFKY